MLVDTHCHLGATAFDEDRDAVVARARAGGVDHIVVVAESVEATARARELAGAFGLSATAGIHPHEASTWAPRARAAIEEALDDPCVVAVGETGLDYHYDHSPRNVQRTAFADQLQLAADRGLPVVVHAREADDDMSAMLREYGSGPAAVILHSFSSGATVFEAGLEIGAYFGWSGMVTFRNWTLDDRVAACPPDRLLVETDAPYLAPVPHRGRRNEPAWVRAVAARVAELCAVSPDTLAERTTTNAVRCFGGRLASTQPTNP